MAAIPGQFGIQVPGTIPVQVIATDNRGIDHLIGDFPGGVVLDGGSLLSVDQHVIIGSQSMHDRSWVIKGKRYRYVFMQVKPRD